jgi:Ca2+-binding RTX toxin-like protein
MVADDNLELVPVLGTLIISNDGDDTAIITLEENARFVSSLFAVSPTNAEITYSIVGGADAALFSMDRFGTLTFNTGPNFEAPTDADGNNVYDVVVAASDGVTTDTQALTVAINDVNEDVAFSGSVRNVSILETRTSAVTTVLATDPENAAISYSVSGDDAAQFVFDSTTGALTFVTPPNFEAPTDANGDNLYNLVITATDGVTQDSIDVSVRVNNINERPVITSNGGGDAASITINEGQVAITTVTSTDQEGVAPTYSLSGADAALFAIDAATGVLSFVNAPDFEAPADADGNNVYDVLVSASDGRTSDAQAIAVTVGNVRDGMTIRGNANTNTLTGTNAEDTIDGRANNDMIAGGLGADTLRGGAGADTFFYNSIEDSKVGETDIISDFRRGQSDKISLDLIDANVNVEGNQSFTFIRSAEFSGTAGELRYEFIPGNTFVSGDIDGDGVADFSIQVNGLVNFTASDFIL